MTDDQSGVATAAKHNADRRTLAAALVVNVLMFCIGLVGWRLAKSATLLADALDMLADASGYAVAYLAIGGSAGRQRAAARWNGAMLIALGIGVFGEVADRWFHGYEPHGIWISAFACLSLLANGVVLRMLSKYRHASEVHLRATWIDTRADVLVNIGVLIAGALIAISGYRVIDLVTGVIIAGFVIHEGWELWESGAGNDEKDQSN
ncbi:MAG: cation transporter [Pseudomonadota bacterium]|nr:cation transporter [Pseudomonadota bacterium]